MRYLCTCELTKMSANVDTCVRYLCCVIEPYLYTIWCCSTQPVGDQLTGRVSEAQLDVGGADCLVLRRAGVDRVRLRTNQQTNSLDPDCLYNR